MSVQLEKIKELIKLRQEAHLGGGQKRIASMPKVSLLLANVLPFFLMKVVLKKLILLFFTVAQTLVLTK